MDQISGLTSFALSPFGLVFVVFAAFAILKARSKRWLPWFALGGLIFAASLSRFVNEWYTDPPRFFGVIDTLVGNGRSITILLLGLVVVMPVRYTREPMGLPSFALAFLAANVVIALKIFAGGSMGFAMLSLATTAIVFFFFSQIYRRWIQSDAEIDAAIVSIAAATSLFVALNAAQHLLGTDALAVANGRFNGTTGNPQHAAAFLGVGIPALIYVALTRRAVLRILAIGAAVIGAYFLLWTGSRTGLLMATAATLLLLRRSGRLAVAAMVLAMASALYVLFTRASSNLDLQRITSFDDTRSHVWLALWRQFLDNPLTGARMSGDRLGFGENSWLAMGATTGLVGLLPLLIGGGILLITAWRLIVRRPSHRAARVQGDFLAGAIVSLMIGSIFEAYLLAVISSATFILLLIGIVATRRLALNVALRSARRRSTPLNAHQRRQRSA